MNCPHWPRSQLTCDLVFGLHESSCTLAITSRLQRQGAWRAESLNIPFRWLAEEAAVFAVELTGAFVSHLKGRGGSIHAIHEHAFPRCLQPELLLILKRAHGGERAKVVVQS